MCVCLCVFNITYACHVHADVYVYYIYFSKWRFRPEKLIDQEMVENLVMYFKMIISRQCSGILSSSAIIVIFAIAIWSHAIICIDAQAVQQCPPHGNIAPCSCHVKKNGLDLLCEFTDMQHISVAMDALKGKSSIIFYLKLRHNILPKLQGFVFLGLDIRHLTIHNSSLAVVEESSLSSIGIHYFMHIHNIYVYKQLKLILQEKH